ncbi:hypothetical protein RRG08_057921 [Elysia crispata]|uniref:Uncharacterized protein n=1 Tax=Elysia crispata TaxID=231223 RepID=A0AAE1AAN3_9GAST|nr:hypothetical protein RRG08_057921 [Elysia crispata]
MHAVHKNLILNSFFSVRSHPTPRSVRAGAVRPRPHCMILHRSRSTSWYIPGVVKSRQTPEPRQLSDAHKLERPEAAATYGSREFEP